MWRDHNPGEEIKMLCRPLAADNHAQSNQMFVFQPPAAAEQRGCGVVQRFVTSWAEWTAGSVVQCRLYQQKEKLQDANTVCDMSYTQGAMHFCAIQQQRADFVFFFFCCSNQQLFNLSVHEELTNSQTCRNQWLYHWFVLCFDTCEVLLKRLAKDFFVSMCVYVRARVRSYPTARMVGAKKKERG